MTAVSRSPHSRPRPAALSGSARTCVGCGVVAPPAEMVRLSLDEAGAPTLARRGRGAHVHPRPRCIAGAAKRGLARSFRREVRVREGALATEIVNAARETSRRALDASWRANAVSVGAAEVGAALEAGDAQSCVVACDAMDETYHPAIATAIGTGRAVASSSRRELGAIVRRDEAPVVGIHHPKLAERIAYACATIDALRVMLVPEVG